MTLRDMAQERGDADEDVAMVAPGTLRASVRIDEPAWRSCDPATLVADTLRVLDLCGLIAGRAEVDVLFADDAEVASLNRAYRGKDAPTNVLAFPSGAPLSEDPRHLGGIVLAFGQSNREAVDRAIPLAHHATHLTLHGMLHLLGFDHQNEDERTRMELIEVRLLGGLGIADPYGLEGSSCGDPREGS